MLKLLSPLVTSPNRLLLAVMVSLTLIVAGCTSSGSNVASYGGPSISSANAKRTAARKDIRQARRDVRAARKDIKKVERSIRNSERKIKRKRTGPKTRKALAKKLRSDKRSLRSAKRALRRAERKLARAVNAEKRANRSIANAKKRKADFDRRLAANARKKREEEKRIARQEKLREQELARKEFERPEPRERLTSRLFSSTDPALKNVNDYQSRVDGSFPIAAIPVDKLNKRFLRQEVSYRSKHKTGTVVVDPRSRFLYLVMSGNRAMRYGIGVGKAGFEWSGSAHIGFKRKWPTWTPPEEMIERRPDLEKWSADNGGMPGGPENPLGARALYLVQGNVDTLYRLHGTPQWNSIGTAASSGCIRLMNQDVIDLYNRVPTGASVVVLS